MAPREMQTDLCLLRAWDESFRPWRWCLYAGNDDNGVSENAAPTVASDEDFVSADDVLDAAEHAGVQLRPASARKLAHELTKFVTNAP